MIGYVYRSTDFFGGYECLFNIHIAKPAVYTNKGVIRLIIRYIEKLLVKKRIAAEIEGLALRLYNKPERLDRMVGKYSSQFKITYFYTVAGIKHVGVFSAKPWEQVQLQRRNPQRRCRGVSDRAEKSITKRAGIPPAHT